MTAQYPKTDLDEIKRTIKLLHLPGDVTELRAIRKNGYIEAGYFDDFDKMAKEAYRLSESGQIVAVYLVPNEGDKALLSRAANRMYTANDGKKDTTADKDIIKINWVLIDADAKRPAGISSTDAQHEAAIKMIYDIRDYLIGLGFNSISIIVADSANGGHILVRVNLKPTTENKSLIKSCIAALKARFETSIVGIDESVINPSRVWKIYGTISKKGDFTDERPHRKAHLLEVPENIVIERIESLQTLAATEPQPEVTAPKTTYQSKGDHPEFDIETWMSAHGIEVTKKEPYNGGQNTFFDHVPLIRTITERAPQYSRCPMAQLFISANTLVVPPMTGISYVKCWSRNMRTGNGSTNSMNISRPTQEQSIITLTMWEMPKD